MGVVHKYLPLVQLKFNNRVSYMFGSSHVISPKQVFKYVGKSSQFRDIIYNSNVLVTEAGDSINNIFRPQFTISNIMKHVVNQDNIHKRVIRISKEHIYHDIPISDYILKSYIKKFNDSAPNGHNNGNTKLQISKTDPFYNTLDKLIKIYPYNLIFDDMDQVNSRFIGMTLYATLCMSGFDSYMTLHYKKHNKSIYSLDLADGYPNRGKNIGTNMWDNIPDNIQDNIQDNSEATTIFNITTLDSLAEFFINIIKSDRQQYSNKWDFISAINRQIKYSNANYLNYEWNKIGNTFDHKSDDTVLLDDRNRKWFSQIVNFHVNNDRVLFIVGASHLQFKNGILDMLTDTGFEIKIWNVDLQQFDILESPV